MSNTTSQVPHPVLHRAQWVVPVISPVLCDGAVLVHAGRVLGVDRFPLLRKEMPAGTIIVDHGPAALMPALVNAHTHLELSALEGAVPFPRSGFPDWFEALFALRAQLTPDEMREGFFRGLRRLADCGTALCGDITNGAAINFSMPQTGGPTHRHVFLEVLGFNRESVRAALPPGIDPEQNGSAFYAVPHAPYSVSAAIITETKKFSRGLGVPFSIHAAEHAEEIEFLQSGTGFCREILDRLERWDPRWTAPGMTPVEYLDGLGALDELTILVHAVHMLETDWDLVARRKCAVCFCPRSNRNINAGLPGIEKALSRGVPACLGTDSLASNTDLDLFREAEFVLDHYPGIASETVLEMITTNPAGFLGYGGEFGGLRPGMRASLLAVRLESETSRLAEALIYHGQKGAWQWVNPPAQR